MGCNAIAYESWPKYDPSKLVRDSIFMMVQVNGKLRDKIEVAIDETEDSIKEKALSSDKVKAFTDGLTIVPGTFINTDVKAERRTVPIRHLSPYFFPNIFIPMRNNGRESAKMT